MAGSDVLIIDDDDATRNGLCELLALEGFSVEAEEDGVQGLRSIQGHDVKVVLLDVLLPGLGGLDVLARCAEERRRVKIIIMTGMDTPETVLGALRDQAYDFLPRPIDPARLIDIVRRALTTASEPAIEVLSAKPEWVECSYRARAKRRIGFRASCTSSRPTSLRTSVNRSVLRFVNCFSTGLNGAAS